MTRADVTVFTAPFRCITVRAHAAAVSARASPTTLPGMIRHPTHDAVWVAQRARCGCLTLLLRRQVAAVSPCSLADKSLLSQHNEDVITTKLHTGAGV